MLRLGTSLLLPAPLLLLWTRLPRLVGHSNLAKPNMAATLSRRSACESSSPGCSSEGDWRCCGLSFGKVELGKT